MPVHKLQIPKSTWIQRKILSAVLAVVSRPRTVLIAAALVLAVSAFSASRWLNVSSDENDLFSHNVQFFRNFLEFDREFPENDAIYVVIEAADPNRPIPPVLRWTAAADAVERNILATARQYCESVDAHVPREKLGSQGLLFESPQELAGDLNDVVRSAEFVRLWGEKNPAFGPLPRAMVDTVLGRTPSQRFLAALNLKPDPEATSLVQHMAQGWADALAHPHEPIRVGANVPNLGDLDLSSPRDLGYYWEPDATDPQARLHPADARHLLLVRVYPKINFNTLTAAEKPVAAIRSAVTTAAKDFPEFQIGTTGRPALDADEMAVTDHDSTIAEIIAAVAVFIGLVVMLRSLWLALAAEMALAVGIGWTFGWATVSVGKLNLLSMVFLIALIGIGMDYLVQILMRYRTEARRHGRPKAIWARVFRYVAAPINTACLGAAGAFLVSTLTIFRGAAELGIIAGGGLLLCLLAGYTVLPALLTLFPPRLAVDVARRPTGQTPRPLGWRRLILPALWVSAIAALSPWAPRARFDPNLLDLQAPKLESTRLIGKLQAWSSVVMTKDLDMLARARTAVERLPAVESTESVLNADDNYRWLRAHQDELPKIEWSPPAPIAPADVATLMAKAKLLANRMEQLPGAAGAVQRAAAAEALRTFAEAAGHASAQFASARLTEWQNVFVAELREMLSQFSPKPLDLSKIPLELRSHLVSADGTYILYINPKPTLNLWDRGDLSLFVNSVQDAVAAIPGHPDVTGTAPNIFYTTRAVRRSFIQATSYALILIVILVLIDLRNLRHTALAISVLALGLPLLIELMGLLGVNWNFANFFGLPILIGAGHEYGVFMIHRYRESVGDPRRVWRFRDVADRALFLCAYITSSSFGFFWAVSEHRGLRSLGLVMALGTGCIYLSTVMVLRPLLLWRLEKRGARISNA
ncbi:MAG TPA: MMPL family transporter [Tepidisphaeraceae bacterium]|jgi:hypothetical protein|nr:MMPL family transporter [Tepidisphaeraceae bacterium]